MQKQIPLVTRLTVPVTTTKPTTKINDEFFYAIPRNCVPVSQRNSYKLGATDEPGAARLCRSDGRREYSENIILMVWQGFKGKFKDFLRIIYVVNY